MRHGTHETNGTTACVGVPAIAKCLVSAKRPHRGTRNVSASLVPCDPHREDERSDILADPEAISRPSFTPAMFVLDPAKVIELDEID